MLNDSRGRGAGYEATETHLFRSAVALPPATWGWCLGTAARTLLRGGFGGGMVMSVDVVVKNGIVVTPEGVFRAGLAIDGGKFVAIARDSELPSAKQEIDAQGNYILPGIVDEHVHILDMGMSDSEDFITGSAAAAAGGVTTVMEMPLTIPATTTLEAFLEKKEVASRKFIVDFALYGGAVPGNTNELPKMVEAGAVGFKAMMTGSVPGLFEILDDGALLEAFRVIAECGSVITLHAENDAIISSCERKLQAEGRKDIWAFFESRPIVQEVEAISRALMLARETGCHLHVVHVSCPEGIELIHQARLAGQKVTSETGPHYLALSQEDGERLGPYLKFAPPVRTKKHTELLWQQLAAGKIDALGSDHGPHPKQNKEKGWENIWAAGNGAIALETTLPVMLSEGVLKGRITLERLVTVLCANPAKLFGIYPQKGAIRVGSDADLVIVDLNREYTIRADRFHSKHKHSPFDGLRVKGMPILTMVRGHVVMQDGQVVGRPGYGQFVAPSRRHIFWRS